MHDDAGAKDVHALIAERSRDTWKTLSLAIHYRMVTYELHKLPTYEFGSDRARTGAAIWKHPHNYVLALKSLKGRKSTSSWMLRQKRIDIT